MNSANTIDPILEAHIELGDLRNEFKHKRRSLLFYIRMLGIVLILFLAGVTGADFLHDGYFSIFAVWIAVLSGILLAILVIYFFVDYKDYGENYGFRGIERIKELIAIKNEIEDTQVKLTFLEIYQTPSLVQYKNQLPHLITGYQRESNRYRRIHYTTQIMIILASLLVSGLTSGLTGLIGIGGNAWIAPTLSLLVSFMTALTALFRFRDRGFNLQQTADSIEFEMSASELRIFDYKGLTDEQALCELAERTERLKNEQRKRQQQLEQASESKHAE